MSDSTEVDGPSSVFEGSTRGEGLSIGIVACRFNDFITERLVSGARHTLARHGVGGRDIAVAWVPGAFEAPAAAQALASRAGVSAVIALGAVIRGATGHYDIVAGQSAAGLMRVQLESGVPVVNGILTTDSIEQAIERAGSKAGNKGAEAAVTAIEMANLLASVKAFEFEAGSGNVAQ